MEEEISPASVPTKPIINWSNTIKAINTNVSEFDDKIIQFPVAGGFRYCRSEQVFESGSHRYEVEVNFDNCSSKEVSYGISYAPELRTDSNVYYFTDAYIYCSAYPSFTKDYTNIQKTVPPKISGNCTLAINFDFDSKKLFWEINGNTYEELDFDNRGLPCYIVIGMFQGNATFT